MDTNLNRWLVKTGSSPTKRQLDYGKKRHYFNDIGHDKRYKQTPITIDPYDSEDLPILKSRKGKRNCKTSKSSKKGLTLFEILSEQKDLEAYKTKVGEVQAMLDVPLKEPVFPKPPMKRYVENLNLDCKQLTINELTEHFHIHKHFLKDIIEGKEVSDRHKKYHSKKGVSQGLTIKSLTYSTSTIVFTFEQIDYIVTLMRHQFDPEDKKTDYFFKVLVPEFCLKVFMRTHNMSKSEAKVYLDKRPID